MPSAPLDSLQTILSVARARLNDMIQNQGGDVLTDSQPFTTVMVNAAYRVLQRKLASLGYLLFEQEVFFSSVPPVYGSPPDPSTQVWFDWTGYFDGNALQTAFALPQWFLSPLTLWERISGGAAGNTTLAQFEASLAIDGYSPTQIAQIVALLPPFPSNAAPPNFLEMDMILNGLPAVPQQQWNFYWEWKNNRIYLPGALGLTDVRIRGGSFLSDFTDISAPGGSSQLVPIVQCEDPFANLICVEMAGSRGDIDAKSFTDKADAGIALIAARDLQASRALAKASEVGKMPDRLTPGAQPIQAQTPQQAGQ
jgi:hypothetical protein